MRGTAGLDCWNLLSWVTLRGFTALCQRVSELGRPRPLMVKPLRQGAGPKRVGSQKHDRSKDMLKGGRCVQTTARGKPLCADQHLLGTGGNETPYS